MQTTIMEHILNSPPKQLIQMHEFENKKLQEIQIHPDDNVEVVVFDKTLVIKIDGTSFYAKLDRPLLHQVGSMIWPDTFGAYTLCLQQWNESLSFLPLLIENALKEQRIVIRYNRLRSGRNSVYGFVSPNFVGLDQMVFRETFLKTLHQAGLRLKYPSVKKRSLGLHKYEFNLPHEVFEFEQDERYEIQRVLVLLHARNNGYNAYKVRWGRVVLVCQNGLESFEEGKPFVWNHTREVQWSNFVEGVVSSFTNGLLQDQENIERRRSTTLVDSQLDDFLDTISDSPNMQAASRARYNFESKHTGDTEWSLSQALTWLGTHETRLTRRERRALRGVGTHILENSLDGYFQSLKDKAA